jgi:hypothetical protein
VPRIPLAAHESVHVCGCGSITCLSHLRAIQQRDGPIAASKACGQGTGANAVDKMPAVNLSRWLQSALLLFARCVWQASTREHVVTVIDEAAGR